MARAALLDRDLPLAASHLEQAIALEPANPSIRAEASTVAFRNGDRQRAVELARSINISQCTSSAELLRCANALLRCDAAAEAAGFLEEALRLSPQNVKIRHRYALALVALNRLAEAQEQWNHCLNYDTGSIEAKVGLARLAMQKSDFTTAIALLQGGADDLPPRRGQGLRLTLAESYFRAGSGDQARELLSRLKRGDSNPRFHYIWGLVHQAAGNPSLAYASIRRCIELLQDQSDESTPQLSPLPDSYPGDEEAGRLISTAIDQLQGFFGPLQSLRTLQQPQADEEIAEEFS